MAPEGTEGPFRAGLSQPSQFLPYAEARTLVAFGGIQAIVRHTLNPES